MIEVFDGRELEHSFVFILLRWVLEIVDCFFLEKDDRGWCSRLCLQEGSEAPFIGRAAECVTRCVEGRRKLNKRAKNEERRPLSLIMGSHSGASWGCRDNYSKRIERGFLIP
jgi:hypothetical protein